MTEGGLAQSMQETNKMFGYGKSPLTHFWYMVEWGGAVLGKTCQSSLGKGQDWLGRWTLPDAQKFEPGDLNQGKEDTCASFSLGPMECTCGPALWDQRALEAMWLGIRCWAL